MAPGGGIGRTVKPQQDYRDVPYEDVVERVRENGFLRFRNELGISKFQVSTVFYQNTVAKRLTVLLHNHLPAVLIAGGLTLELKVLRTSGRERDDAGGK